MFFVALGLAGYYLGLYLLGGIPIQGFTTLVLLTLGLHGISFIFLGIFGEYMSRIFDDSKKRPRVIITESLHLDSPPTFL